MRLQMKNGPICNVKFKYEDLTTFCFVCGVLGHSERFCEKAFETPPHLLTKPYNIELKVAPRRRNHTISAKWLKPTMAKREENLAPYVGIPTSVLRPSMAGNQGSVIGGNHGENSIISDGDREIFAEEIRREIDGSKESQLGVAKKGKTINESFMGGDMEEDAVVNIIDLKRRKFECEGLIGPNTENVNVGQSSTVAELPKRWANVKVKHTQIMISLLPPPPPPAETFLCRLEPDLLSLPRRVVTLRTGAFTTFSFCEGVSNNDIGGSLIGVGGGGGGGGGGDSTGVGGGGE
ncbi:hypothetical protein G4B88_001609 [Cannabis sativa]|uniref:Zinc knuckle CX2CX4HX4C domain-containing protein n=1 Tax=Cannabis sativa TaxID=3483 RepID=A0A7J6I2F4_CANSA|nr:hypothetical protein G4B88_001609 [Cannabis sativa]